MTIAVSSITKRFNLNVIFKEFSYCFQTNSVTAILGPNGSGKSTLAKIILGLENANGSVLPKYETGKIQLIFQQPGAALDPSQKALHVIIEALSVAGIHGKKNREKQAFDLMQKVGLTIDSAHKYPFQLSGGQKQRLCIARALCSKPKILVCDEALSSLDEMLKDQILALLIDLNIQEGLTIIFISHDIDLVAKISHRIIVVDSGEIVENGRSHELLNTPKSKALKELLDARI